MRLTEAIRHPVAACRKLLRRIRSVALSKGAADPWFWRRFEREFALSPEQRRTWADEADALEHDLQARWRAVAGPWPRSGCLEATCRKVLYLALRALRPKTVVETGVANGASSLFALHALRRGGGGVLWSLEPEGVPPFVPEGFEVGWLVPDELRPGWRLIRRSSLEGLPDLWPQTGEVDLFFHDSEHSYEVMSAEYVAAWPRLRRGGVLVSDDVFFNDAFDDFAQTVGVRHFVWRNRLGFLIKP